jgi:hypothetical protein
VIVERLMREVFPVLTWEPDPYTPYEVVGGFAVDVGEQRPMTARSDSAGLLLIKVTETRTAGERDEVLDFEDRYEPIAELVRNEEIPDDPYYDDDGNPVTPGAPEEIGLGGLLGLIGRGIYVSGSYGTAEDWENMTVAERANWIDDYEAP